MIERMCAYQRTTGLKPIGLHRPTAIARLERPGSGARPVVASGA
jgi:hypothetical protein